MEFAQVVSRAICFGPQQRFQSAAALAPAGGNKSQAAKALGISRFALQRKLDKYGIGKTRRRNSKDDATDDTEGGGDA